MASGAAAWPAAVIRSPQNERIKRLRKLHERRHRNALEATLVEGRRFVEEALAAGRRIRQVIFTERFAATAEGWRLLERLTAAGTALAQVPEALLADVAVTETPQGILAEVEVEPPEPADASWWQAVRDAPVPVVLLPDRVQDPGNLGTLLRAVEGLGAAGAVLVPGTVDPFHPRAVRAAAAASLRVALRSAASAARAAEEARAAGLEVWVADADGELASWEVDWSRPALVLVGNEGAGVSPEAVRAASGRVAIPLAGAVGSLNAAMAGTILLYEAARQLASRRAR
ncbi:MAG: RNA methyltransferase [Bacillota bacterium]|nr:MAG: RNA methyltransferase [Bacillota bacterium]